MKTDYTEYNNRYNYMRSVLRQIQASSSGTSSIYSAGLVDRQESLSFADVFRNVASEVEVPESMDAIFEEAAEKYDVPVALLKAMGKAESNFNANAVSSAGAQGVMQLMPATARALGVDDPFDARSNIMGGAKYISGKLKQYNGNIELALAAYNAGSGNVKKYGGVPPFKETRNYISKIKKYMQTDISIDKTVYSKEKRDTLSDGVRPPQGMHRGMPCGYETPETVFNQEDALYFVEMMKLQMQNRLAISSQWNQISTGNGINYI